ncbi:hypothetical protein GS432_21555 [Rhodococcus hoagii]|nr:hypothetical protein [Prescottella equi]MBM4577184.1 hypothetical protein [Prescottella equi]NKV09735.1 hypothetical protein [Prescottella equi]
MGTMIQLALAAIAGGALNAIINALVGRRRSQAETGKIDADAAQVIANTAVQLVGPINERMGQLEQRIRALEDENRHERLRGAAKLEYIRVLMRWIAEHLPGRTPPEPPALLREELLP